MDTDTSQATITVEHCRICGEPSASAHTHPGADSCCTYCLLILDWFKDWLNREVGISPNSVALSLPLVNAHNGDSFGLVELLMALEDEFGATFPQGSGIQLDTIEDAIRCIRGTNSAATKQAARRFWSRSR